MKNIIFIAPPAAGKGTQSSYLKELGFNQISTGDMLREEISKGSPLGDEINKIIEKGNLVSDEIVIKLIDNKLSNISNNNFILDGFPRTLNQAIELDKLFEKNNIQNYVVIYLSLDLDTGLKRVLGRLTCTCGKSYNIYFDDLKPKVEGICDNCNNKLEIRKDDNEETFTNRFNTFISNSNPIIDFYKEKNKLYEISAKEDSLVIFNKIKEIIND